ncbi:MAG: hypothetical protein K2P79_09465 [Sphingomonas sp.]|nr:hypothetical protein [Sphingomonas sp.]
MAMLVKVDRFLRASGMSATRFGRLAVRDPGLVRDLRRGRSPRPETLARIEAFLEQQA